MKVCIKCKIEKKETDFSKNKTKKDGLNSWCRECYRMRYVNHRESHISEAIIRHHNYKKRNQEFIFELLSKSKCVDCGYDNILALEFDHTDGTKEDCVSTMASSGRSMNRVLEEIKKCDIVCANCHSIRTHLRNNTNRVQYMLSSSSG